MRTSVLVVASLLLAACSTGSSGLNRSASADPARSPVPTRHPFEVQGKVQAVSGEGFFGLEEDALTIARDDAPAARLRVVRKTQITLEERRAHLSDLREGDAVRALFDFDRGRPIAIQIVAEPARR